jgi:hypothetical protein
MVGKTVLYGAIIASWWAGWRLYSRLRTIKSF